MPGFGGQGRGEGGGRDAGAAGPAGPGGRGGGTGACWGGRVSGCTPPSFPPEGAAGALGRRRGRGLGSEKGTGGGGGGGGRGGCHLVLGGAGDGAGKHDPRGEKPTDGKLSPMSTSELS